MWDNNGCEGMSIMRRFNRFKSDERGTIAVMFGFVLIVLALFSGIAVDVSRAYGVSSFVSAAIDSTALATAHELQKRDMTDAEVQQFAQIRYNALLANRANSGVTFETLNIVVDRNAETVQVSADSVVPTHFAGLAGTDTLNVSESTTVSYNVRVVELALVLDVTGSMSGTKIEDLRTAATDLVEQLIPVNPRNKSNRVALAPYATTVNAGSLASQLTAMGNDSLDGCVAGRDGADATTDAAPGPGASLVANDPGAPLADKDPYQGDATYGCPSASVLPLSKDRSDLVSRINDFAAGGWTAGHLGATWGWYLVSENWRPVFASSAKPALSSDEDTIKAVLLMTDGDFNTRFVGSNGDTSDEHARETCTNMKNAGILVYSVAFDAPPAAEATLRDCATSDQHYFSADNAAELNAAFQSVAETLTSLRLTN